MAVKKICVLGGTGFVGSHLVCRLVNPGYSVVVLTRKREHGRHLSVLPNVQLRETNVHDPAALSAHLSDVDAVVNLIGILNEGRALEQRFQTAHTDLPNALLEACKQSGVGRLLQMSALNAGAETGSSLYLRSKGAAENALLAGAGPDLRVSFFQPSVIFGPGDSFFNRFATLLKSMPVFPLACPNSRFAPVYVGDVVDTMCAELARVDGEVATHHTLCGPGIYSLRELVQYTADTLGLRTAILNLPDFLARVQATIMSYLPGKPFTRDNYQSLQTDSVCPTGCPHQPTSVEHIVPRYLLTPSKQAHLQQLRQRARRE